MTVTVSHSSHFFATGKMTVLKLSRIMYASAWSCLHCIQSAYRVYTVHLSCAVLSCTWFGRLASPFRQFSVCRICLKVSCQVAILVTSWSERSSVHIKLYSSPQATLSPSNPVSSKATAAYCSYIEFKTSCALKKMWELALLKFCQLNSSPVSSANWKSLGLFR